MSVTVYTLPSCPQCDQTKKYLTRNDITFSVIPLEDNEEATNMVKALGYQSAPVVVAGESHWSGFRMDRLTSLVAELNPVA